MKKQEEDEEEEEEEAFSWLVCFSWMVARFVGWLDFNEPFNLEITQTVLRLLKSLYKPDRIHLVKTYLPIVSFRRVISPTDIPYYL